MMISNNSQQFVHFFHFFFYIMIELCAVLCAQSVRWLMWSLLQNERLSLSLSICLSPIFTIFSIELNWAFFNFNSSFVSYAMGESQTQSK